MDIHSTVVATERPFRDFLLDATHPGPGADGADGAVAAEDDIGNKSPDIAPETGSEGALHDELVAFGKIEPQVDTPAKSGFFEVFKERLNGVAEHPKDGAGVQMERLDGVERGACNDVGDEVGNAKLVAAGIVLSIEFDCAALW